MSICNDFYGLPEKANRCLQTNKMLHSPIKIAIKDIVDISCVHDSVHKTEMHRNERRSCLYTSIFNSVSQ